MGHVHDLYIEPASQSVLKVRARKRFIDTLRRYPVEVLQQAERVFRLQVHRGDIRERAAYFARLVRDAHLGLKRQRGREHEQREREQRDAIEVERMRRDDAANIENPSMWLRKALGLIATQWRPASRTLLADGAGLGLVYLRGAIAGLVDRHGTVIATDIANTVFREFARAQGDVLGPLGLAAIRDLLDRALPKQATSSRNLGFGPALVVDKLIPSGKNRHPRHVDPLPS